MKDNPPRRIARACTGIIIAGIFIIFLPGIIGLDGFDGGFAMSVGGGLVAIVGLISAIIYGRLASALDRVVKKENVIAHWTYSTGEWRAYTEKEHKEDASEKKGLFLVISGAAVVIGLGLWLLNRDDAIPIVFIVLGIIVFFGAVALLTSASTYWANRRRIGEAWISRDGVYLNRRTHIWKGIGTRLEGAEYEAGTRSIPVIRFDYSAAGRGGRHQFTARVPVPAGQEARAREIVSEVLAAHRPDR